MTNWLTDTLDSGDGMPAEPMGPNLALELLVRAREELERKLEGMDPEELGAMRQEALAVLGTIGKAGKTAQAGQILGTVCAYFGTTRYVLLSRRREAAVVEARMILMYLLYRSGMTLVEVGAFMGMHHTAVLHGKRKIEDLLSIGDRRTMRAVTELDRALYGDDISPS